MRGGRWLLGVGMVAACGPAPVRVERAAEAEAEADVGAGAGEAVCPGGMELVAGMFHDSMEHVCARYLSVKQDRCEEYLPSPQVVGRGRELRFCIDRYEYPNLPGVKPVLMVDWYEAGEACAVEGKRLCRSSEWTLACEGPEHLPYPYGLTRDREACNIDRPRPVPEPDFLAFRRPRAIADEVARLDLRVASGEREGCVSGYGVRDLTGNVDEWVINEAHFAPLGPDKTEEDRPYVSGLKGGYWGPIRARCRPMTTAHNAWFRFYQVGFRCCADPLDGGFRGKPLPPLPSRPGVARVP